MPKTKVTVGHFLDRTAPFQKVEIYKHKNMVPDYEGKAGNCPANIREKEAIFFTTYFIPVTHENIIMIFTEME